MIEQKIKQLEEDYKTYRNICCFKLKAIKGYENNELKKCSICNGYSSVQDCDDFVDIPHLINFYKDFYEKQVSQMLVSQETSHYERRVK